MSDIQNIAITSTQTVQQPKPHTTYTIQITTPIRTWTVSRRYNDFVALHAELVSSTGKEPPAILPAKHTWSLTRAVFDDKIVRERKILLETYLRSILTNKDARWRTSYTYLDFLSVPNTKHTSNSTNSTSNNNPFSSPPETWTPTSWITEQSSLSSILRNVRSALLKRDALAGMGDATGSRSASVEAKKLLKDIESRIGGLERGLVQIGGNLGEGEKRRREEMIENIRVERNNLARMAEAGVRTASGAFNRSSPESSSSQLQLQNNGTMPGGLNSLWGNNSNNGGGGSGRVFGKKAVPEETAITRPLDDRGLLQLQQEQMKDQDDNLTELSKLLQRQRIMGEQIHTEIGQQNEILEEIDSGIDKTGRKLGRAKREMNRLG